MSRHSLQAKLLQYISGHLSNGFYKIQPVEYIIVSFGEQNFKSTVNFLKRANFLNNSERYQRI